MRAFRSATQLLGTVRPMHSVVFMCDRRVSFDRLTRSILSPYRLRFSRSLAELLGTPDFHTGDRVLTGRQGIAILMHSALFASALCTTCQEVQQSHIQERKTNHSGYPALIRSTNPSATRSFRGNSIRDPK